jgi:hypothetical protein
MVLINNAALRASLSGAVRHSHLSLKFVLKERPYWDPIGMPLAVAEVMEVAASIEQTTFSIIDQH